MCVYAFDVRFILISIINQNLLIINYRVVSFFAGTLRSDISKKTSKEISIDCSSKGTSFGSGVL